VAQVIDGFAELGLNSVRLQFSNQMIHDTNPVPDLPANPDLHGKPPLQVYDKVVERLTARGFAVILNNHTTTSRWCCGLDGNVLRRAVRPVHDSVGAQRPHGLVRPGRQPPGGNPGGEFANGNYKGQCATTEYVAGVAYTGRIGSRKTLDALLCRDR
jgi:hypothetical protein